MKKASTKALLTVLFLFLTNFVFAISGGDKASVTPKIDSTVFFSGRPFVMFKDSSFVYIEENNQDGNYDLFRYDITINGKKYKTNEIRILCANYTFWIVDKTGSIYSAFVRKADLMNNRIIGFDDNSSFSSTNSSGRTVTRTFIGKVYFKDFDYTRTYQETNKGLLALVGDNPESLSDMRSVIKANKKIKKAIFPMLIGIVIGLGGVAVFTTPLLILAWIMMVGGFLGFVYGILHFNIVKRKQKTAGDISGAISRYNAKFARNK